MGINIGLGKTTPYLALGGKIKPSEIDNVQQHLYLKVSGSDSAVMNACACGSKTSATGTITNGYPDYPRNLLVSFTETGGTVFKGTATVTGKDQFGEAVSETFACVSLGTTGVGGSKIFDQITAVSAVIGSYGTGAVDLRVGFPIGAGSAKFGLYTKISAATDVKRITWVDNGVVTPCTAVVDTTYHAFASGGAITAAQDDFVVWVNPNYSEDDDGVSYAGTSALIS
ncbi:hypothetical protein KJ836_02665 [Patescibacteria group bacterium]|nr:hypothetical protein [Patescibacteria group bacterium]